MANSVQYRVLVTGAYGQLGTALRQYEGTEGYEFLFRDKDTLNILDKDELAAFFAKEKPNVVINCAAYTNVDKAEDEEDLALQLNAVAVGYISDLCTEYGARLLHISTDYVFEGNATEPIVESCERHPQSAYGRTKEKGEIEALRCPHGFVVRTAWLYNTTMQHVNFRMKMLELATKYDTLKVVNSQCGSPTHVDTLAKALFKMISIDIPVDDNRIYHCTNGGAATWYDFAKAIFSLEKGAEHITVEPVADFPSKAKRPTYSVLSCAKLEKLLGYSLPKWDEELKAHCSGDDYMNLLNKSK